MTKIECIKTRPKVDQNETKMYQEIEQDID